MRAGAGAQKAAVLNKTHAAAVDLAVAPRRGLDGIPRLGEGGRIENHHIKLLSGLSELRKQFEYVPDQEIHAVLKSVQRGVLAGLIDGEGGGIDGRHMCRTGQCCVQCERAGVGEAVQHFGAPADAVDGAPVLLLIQEKAGLLTVFHIHDIYHAVFGDLNFCVKRLGEESFCARHAFFFAHFGVAALIDAADLHAVFCQNLNQAGENEALQTVDAQRQRFDDQNIFIFVHGQTREEIRLPEDQPAGGQIHDPSAVVHGLTDFPFYKGGRHRLRFLPGENPDPDGGRGVDKAVSEKISVVIFDADELAVRTGAFYMRDFVVINPQSALLESPGFSLLHARGTVCGQGIRSLRVQLQIVVYGHFSHPFCSFTIHTGLLL